MAPTLEWFEQVEAKDALAVIAFPTTGQAAPIAAHYLIEHLDLPLIGQIRIPGLDQIMAVSKGRATSVLRIFGGQVECSLEHGCPTIFLITTEVPLPPQAIAEVSELILKWASETKVHLTLVLEGVGRDDDDAAPPNVFSASDREDVLDEIKKAGVEPAGNGLIAGIGAELLLKAKQHNVRAGVLMVEASGDHPDGRAAAALIQTLDLLLPDVKVDPEPLLEEALKLEERLRRQAQPAQDYVAGRPHTFI